MSQSESMNRRITRASNADKHPGAIDISPGSKPKKVSRTKAEKEADKKRKRDEEEDKAARHLATLLTIAKIEMEQRAIHEAEMANAANPIGGSQVSKAVINLRSDDEDLSPSVISRGRGGSRGRHGGHGGRDGHGGHDGDKSGGRDAGAANMDDVEIVDNASARAGGEEADKVLLVSLALKFCR